jgi:hypothetical protein
MPDATQVRSKAVPSTWQPLSNFRVARYPLGTRDCEEGVIDTRLPAGIKGFFKLATRGRPFRHCERKDVRPANFYPHFWMLFVGSEGAGCG